MQNCGYSSFLEKMNTTGFFEPTSLEKEEYSFVVSETTPVELYTTYLGKVIVDVVRQSTTEVLLEDYHTVGSKKIMIKVLDSQEHNLSADSRYTLNKLKSLSGHKINTELNKCYYVLGLLALRKIAQINKNTKKIEEISTELLKLEDIVEKTKIKNKEYNVLHEKEITESLNTYKKIYQIVSVYNSAVDIIFNTRHYLDFLYQETGIVSVNGLDALIGISNVPNLDNAFFTGQYSLYGNGDKVFYPLVSADVIGHELSHGLVAGTAGLEYKGHSGALNESFSDIVGAMFEFYMYKKFPSLKGEADWLIGEDLGMKKSCLRSMEDPNVGQQPKIYKGKYYVNPNSTSDHGGVHSNSGIPNYCFFLAKTNKKDGKILPIFMNCLKMLSAKSNFADFRDKLKKASKNDPIVLEALKTVGFNDDMVTDYGKPKRRIPLPTQTPYPFPPQTPYPFPPQTPYPFPQQLPYPFPQQLPYPFPQQLPYPFPQQTPYPFPFPPRRTKGHQKTKRKI